GPRRRARHADRPRLSPRRHAPGGAGMRVRLLLLVVLALAGVAVPVVLAATPNRIAPTQRLDAKVLLLSADGTEPGFAAWKYQLTREGVPFDAVVSYAGAAKARTLTDAQLAD